MGRTSERNDKPDAKGPDDASYYRASYYRSGGLAVKRLRSLLERVAKRGSHLEA